MLRKAARESRDATRADSQILTQSRFVSLRHEFPQEPTSAYQITFSPLQLPNELVRSCVHTYDNFEPITALQLSLLAHGRPPASSQAQKMPGKFSQLCVSDLQ